MASLEAGGEAWALTLLEQVRKYRLRPFLERETRLGLGSLLERGGKHGLRAPGAGGDAWTWTSSWSGRRGVRVAPSWRRGGGVDVAPSWGGIRGVGVALSGS